MHEVLCNMQSATTEYKCLVTDRMMATLSFLYDFVNFCSTVTVVYMLT